MNDLHAMKMQEAPKPKVFDLTFGSIKFIWENRIYAFNVLKPILIFWLPLNAISTISQSYIHEGFAALSLLEIYFYACTALVWHRASLQGIKYSHAVNPFDLKKGEGGFIGVLFLIWLVIFALMIIPIGLLSGTAFLFEDNKSGIIAIIGLIAIAFLFYISILGIRFTFILPARSVGVKLSFAQARKLSKGLVRKLLLSSLLLVAIVMFPVGIYLGIAGVIVSFTFGDPTESLMAALGAYILIGLPVFIYSVAVSLFSVTVLSRLYQWAVQERGYILDEPLDEKCGDFKYVMKKTFELHADYQPDDFAFSSTYSAKCDAAIARYPSHKKQSAVMPLLTSRSVKWPRRGIGLTRLMVAGYRARPWIISPKFWICTRSRFMKLRAFTQCIILRLLVNILYRFAEPRLAGSMGQMIS